MNIVEESFDHSTFSANRERLMEHDVVDSEIMPPAIAIANPTRATLIAGFSGLAVRRDPWIMRL